MSLQAAISEYIIDLSKGKTSLEDARNWFRKNAPRHSLKFGKHFQFFVTALEERGIKLHMPTLEGYASNKLDTSTFDTNLKTDFPEISDLIKNRGLEAALRYLSSKNVNSRVMAQFLQDNWEDLKTQTLKLFDQGKFPDLEILLRRRGVATEFNPEENTHLISSKDKICFLRSFDSGVSGQAVALQGDTGRILQDDGEKILVQINDNPNQTTKVDKRDEFRIWKYSSKIDIGNIIDKCSDLMRLE